ncbi:MAG TPA: response regulator [Chloroflexota bacterium]|nr:response regulator [Chloroflexota bacterium]
MTHKLLIVDDHPETLEIISRVLRQQGYAVIAAASGVQALTLADAEQPDLILLDGMMPDLDGWEVCRRIRNNPKIAHTRIIMFSAVNVAEQKLAGFNAGADDYLTKPTEPVELIERVQNLLENVPPRPDLAGGAPPVAEPPAAKAAAMGRTVALSPSSQVIAVLGARGGAGTTQLAINLAISLAGPELPATLVDLDVRQGHVGLYLNQKVSNGLNKLARLPENTLGRDVSARLMPYNDHLQLLLTESDLSATGDVPSAGQMEKIMEMLAVLGGTVVVDCGLGITAVNRPIIEQADHLLLCVQPERVGLAAAKLFMAQLQNVLFPHTQLHLVLLEFGGSMTIPQQAIESFLGWSVSAIIPIPPQDLRRAVNKSIPLVQLNPEGKVAVMIGQLARQLVKT